MARAADPQPYKVNIQGTGSGEMDRVLRSSSQLASLQDKVPVPPFALVQRAEADIARFQTALDSFGYYLNSVTIKIAGHDLSDPELPEFLDEAPANPPVAVDVALDKGPLFHIGTIAFDGTVPAADRNAVRIKSGDPAIANAVLDAQAQLLAALQEDGYALATVEAPIAFADNEKHEVNLTYRVITGPRLDIGRIVFSGDWAAFDRDESIRRRYLAV